MEIHVQGITLTIAPVVAITTCTFAITVNIDSISKLLLLHNNETAFNIFLHACRSCRNIINSLFMLNLPPSCDNEN